MRLNRTVSQEKNLLNQKYCLLNVVNSFYIVVIRKICYSSNRGFYANECDCIKRKSLRFGVSLQSQQLCRKCFSDKQPVSIKIVIYLFLDYRYYIVLINQRTSFIEINRNTLNLTSKYLTSL